MCDKIKTDDGGPAFPATEAHGLNSGMWGMTLRDYFAAKVVNGILSAEHDNREYGMQSYSDMAEQAYAIADAMLAARRADKA